MRSLPALHSAGRLIGYRADQLGGGLDLRFRATHTQPGSALGAINAARGVNSDAVVRNLIDRNLLVESGRDQSSPGTPALLDVTEDFLVAAGARDRADFPSLDEIVDPEEISRVRERIGGGGREGERPDDGTRDPEGG